MHWAGIPLFQHLSRLIRMTCTALGRNHIASTPFEAHRNDMHCTGQESHCVNTFRGPSQLDTFLDLCCVLAQGPRESSLDRSNFNGWSPKGILKDACPEHPALWIRVGIRRQHLLRPEQPDIRTGTNYTWSWKNCTERNPMRRSHLCCHFATKSATDLGYHRHWWLPWSRERMEKSKKPS